MTHINRFAVLSGVLLSAFATSCVNEVENELTPVAGGEGYYISLTGDINKDGIDTRAHWDINTEDQSLAFAWDNSSNEMKSFVWRSNAFVDFKEGKKYSATTVTPTDNVAELNITDGLSQEYAQGDIIWAVSPLSDTNIGTDNKVTFTLPDGFTQDKLNSTEHLKPYILMSGTGTVDGENKANIAFDVLSAIYRFKIVNNESTELIVNEVSVSGPFCDKAELSMNGTVTALYSISNGASYTIKVSTPTGGLKVDGNGTAYLYALVFPTETSSKNDNITLSFKGKYGDSNVIVNKTKVCNTVYPDKDLESNTYYDMVVPVSSSDINEDVVIEDYPKMYLADVAKDDANLKQDIFGVPMLIDRVGSYQYRARYYNEKAGTEIYFIPNRDSFSPICIGADKNGDSKLSLASDAQPIILTEANKYYEINLNLTDLTYSMSSYSVEQVDDPWAEGMRYRDDTLNKWATTDLSQATWMSFEFGWTPDKPYQVEAFKQDETNPHLFYVDKVFPYYDEARQEYRTDFNFIIHNYHTDEWWNFIAWYRISDVEDGVFGRFSDPKYGEMYINPDFSGPISPDNSGWTYVEVGENTGTYRIYFDSHLGRAKLVKVND